MSQTVPTEPGWWWVERPDGGRVCVEVYGGRFGVLWAVDAEGSDVGVTSPPRSFGRWLAPVAKHEEVEQLRAEVARMSEWLYRIGGADSPTDDAEQLRRWAYDALTLGREVPS